MPRIYRIIEAVLMLMAAGICLALSKIEHSTEGFSTAYWIFLACMVGCIVCAVVYWIVSEQEAKANKKCPKPGHSELDYRR